MSYETTTHIDSKFANAPNKPDLKSTDDSIEGIVFGDVVGRLQSEGVPERLGMEEGHVVEILKWSEQALPALAGYERTLGMPVKASLESYFEEHSVSPMEFQEERKRELQNLLLAAEKEIMDHYAQELGDLEKSVREELQEQGVDNAQVEWQVEQAKQWRLGEIHTYVIMPRREEIFRQIEAEYPTPERIPPLYNRFYQLADLYAKKDALEKTGMSLKLIPVPYKTIDETILPAFSAQDTSPRQWPNHGRDLGNFYLDPAYIGVLRGNGMFKRRRSEGTYYQDTRNRDEAIGDFGLALVAANEPGEAINSGMTLDDIREQDSTEKSSPKLGNADFAIGIVLALEIVEAIERGEMNIDKYNPVKIVLPGFIRTSYDINTALLSVYLHDPDNPYDRRLGIAFNSYTARQARHDGFEVALAATTW